MEKNAVDGLAKDPVSYAQQTGTFTTAPLSDDQSFQTRGRDAKSIADYYSISSDEMKPLTEAEATELKKKFTEGSADDALAIMASMQQMGSDMARAAMKQIGEKDTVYAYAAGLSLEDGQETVASDIIRGQKRIQENPAIKDDVGATPSDINAEFKRITGTALYELEPRQRQAVQDAAMAHYIETTVARGPDTSFDGEKFEASVKKVLGDSFDDVNGDPTQLPRGVTGDEVEDAMARMTDDDWVEMSVQKVPPLYVDGTPISADQLADEARWKWIGAGKYKIMLDDGSYAITGNLAANGRYEAFIIEPTADQIKELAARTGAASDIEIGPIQEDAVKTEAQDAQERLQNTQNPLSNFDENGRWIAPK
jgi:hypothetical protein